MCMDDKKLKYMKLTQIPGFGLISQRRLLDLCGGIDECFYMSGEEIERLDKAAEPGKRVGKDRIDIFIRGRDNADTLENTAGIMDKCFFKGISVITSAEPEYPMRFTGFPDMPVVLYVLGNLKINCFERSVGIVGARRCSQLGKQGAISIAQQETDKGAAIISGMAKGIDSYAHTATLLGHGYTIAVLGNGADICYPKEHEKLYSEIISTGCVISEVLPGTKPRSFLFPLRNRLIAALSDELYVIDAGRHSGTASTVEYATRYGRKVALMGAGN